MKTIFYLISFSSLNLYSQVIIGDTNLKSTSSSLEFGTGNRGIVLPWVSSAALVSNPVNGTFIFDTSDKKVKYYKNGSWFDLSKDDTGIVDTSLQDSKTEDLGAKLIIGNNINDNANGILVLSDTNRAMILPKVVSPHLNIINPSPGMMVYDVTSHQLAVFNGTVWSFWKP